MSSWIIMPSIEYIAAERAAAASSAFNERPNKASKPSCCRFTSRKRSCNASVKRKNRPERMPGNIVKRERRNGES